MLFWLLNQHEVARYPSLPQTQHLVVEVDEVDYFVVVLVALDVLALAGVLVVAPDGALALAFLFVVVDVAVVDCGSCYSPFLFSFFPFPFPLLPLPFSLFLMMLMSWSMLPMV